MRARETAPRRYMGFECQDERSMRIRTGRNTAKIVGDTNLAEALRLDGEHLWLGEDVQEDCRPSGSTAVSSF